MAVGSDSGGFCGYGCLTDHEKHRTRQQNSHVRKASINAFGLLRHRLSPTLPDAATAPSRILVDTVGSVGDPSRNTQSSSHSAKRVLGLALSLSIRRDVEKISSDSATSHSLKPGTRTRNRKKARPSGGPGQRSGPTLRSYGLPGSQTRDILTRSRSRTYLRGRPDRTGRYAGGSPGPLPIVTPDVRASGGAVCSLQHAA